jgi:hypothetical protein
MQLAKHAVSFGKKSADVRLLLAKRHNQFSSSRLLVARHKMGVIPGKSNGRAFGC